MSLFLVIPQTAAMPVTLRPELLSGKGLADVSVTASTPDEAVREFLKRHGFQHRTGSPDFEAEEVRLDVYRLDPQFLFEREGTREKLYDKYFPSKATAK